MKLPIEVLRRIAALAKNTDPDSVAFSAALAIATLIVDELKGGPAADTKRIRTLAAEGSLVLGLGGPNAVFEAGAAPTLPFALQLWFDAMKWIGRGMFDGAMGAMLSKAADMVAELERH